MVKINKMDEIVQVFDGLLQEQAKLHNNISEKSFKRLDRYTEILKSRFTSKSEKDRAKSSILSEFSDYAIFTNAFTSTLFDNVLVHMIQLLKNSVDGIEKQLVESGVIEKVKAVEDSKKVLEDVLRKIKTDLKKVEENREKSLDYIK